MPRLIPRLLRHLQRTHSLPPKPVSRLAWPSSRDNVTPQRVFTRPKELDITPTGRRQSILLERKALRLIYRHARWRREKSLAPEVRVSRAKWERKQRHGRAPPGMIPREMTAEERSLWANPYLRMLGSPLRRCFETLWSLPRDLMIRMSPMLVPGEEVETVFLPTSLEHPAFRQFKGGKTRYLLCWKSVLESVQKTESYKRWSPETSSDMSMHSLVIQQVGHALRVRVLQELHILARQLRRRSQPSSPPLLRRLTRAEWNEVKSSGVVPFKSAVAILVVPPLNRDTSTKTRPEPNANSVPSDKDLAPTQQTSRSLPLSILYPINKNEGWSGVDNVRLLPRAQVPHYNGIPLFPSRTQRAALYASLAQVLESERRSRSTQDLHDTPREGPKRVKGDQKASHAVVVCSDEKTVLRGDTVPLAIALWRLRMWEGGADSDGTTSLTGWATRPPRAC